MYQNQLVRTGYIPTMGVYHDSTAPTSWSKFWDMPYYSFWRGEDEPLFHSAISIKIGDEHCEKDSSYTEVTKEEFIDILGID